MNTTVAPAGAPGRGPLGNTRSIGLCILWAILTLGIYTFIWTYKTQDEIKRYSGNGVGGVLGLVIYILISPVTYFLVPSETRYMYEDLDGGTSPVRGILRPLVPAAADRQPDLVHSGAGSAQPLLGEQGSYRLKPAWTLGTRPPGQGRGRVLPSDDP